MNRSIIPKLIKQIKKNIFNRRHAHVNDYLILQKEEEGGDYQDYRYYYRQATRWQ